MNSPHPNQQYKCCSFITPCGAWNIRSDQKKQIDMSAGLKKLICCAGSLQRSFAQFIHFVFES